MFDRVRVPLCMLLAAVLASAALPPTAAAGPQAETHDTPGAAETLEGRDPYDTTLLPRHVRKVVFRASAYGKRGNYEKAIELLEEHLRDHPDQDHHLLRLHLAQHYSDLGEPEQALENYRAALKLRHDLDRAWFGLGDTAYDLERFEVAGEAFLAGYETSRERPAEVLYYAAASYLQADKPEEALPIFERLLDERAYEAHLKWYQGAVVAALAVEDPARVDDEIDQLMRTQPDNHEAWYLKYQHLVGKRAFRDAAICLTVVGYMRELTPIEQKQLGDLYSVTEVPWLASRRYEAGLGPDPTAADYERLVSALVAAHETDDALNVLGRALIEVESKRLVSLLGDIHYLHRDYEKAATAFARLERMGDDTGRAHLMQGYCALELGNKEEAMTHLGRASNYEDQEDMAQMLMQRAMRMES